ncbi:NAD(P)-dependent oxidoreductase [Sporolactobacillus terrae]|uniref:4-phosphoerythronate dehydrogenase n=1 Tax=Sporolactobacillus terrae TaxID=269673 RepID=A0A5K7WT66_9BACL|nr:NAD(P)-dependent oxidoreductase [Sporolactobacillus terrae]BBN97881.1 4-phosphoerythronate dehydrogenase [Sporolactobacillus terrae]
MNVLFSVGKAYLPIADSFINRMKAAGLHVTVLYEDKMDKQKIIEKIHEADIYVTAVAKADQEVIDAAPHLKYILKTGTGVDNIDLNYAREKGIVVTNAPGGNAESVAELVIGMILSLSRSIPQLDRKTKQNQWVHSTGFEIKGKILGIIGFGTIGKLVARYAEAFRMNIIAYGHYQDHETANRLGVTFVPFEELIRLADYLVISTSLKKSNFHLIDRSVINQMKSTACLINVSRGAIIHEVDLFEALEQRRIRGAALDVFEIEPPVQSLEHLTNLIATPHVGGTTMESAYRIADITIEQIKRIIDRKPLDYVLNKV